MTKLNHDWIVQPHGAVTQVADGILTVAGTIRMPLGSFPRRMTVVTLADGGTAVWSAIPLDPTGMAAIEAAGAPRFLIVPNQAHRLDLAAWKARYPDAAVIAPPGARKAVAEAAPVAATLDVLGDPAVGLATVPGLKQDEFAMTVRRSDGVTLVLNDILANVHHPRGIGQQVMARLFGFGVDRPRTPRPVRRMFVGDAAKLAAQFRSWADLPELCRIIVSHGEVIARDPAGALRRAADDLSS